MNGSPEMASGRRRTIPGLGAAGPHPAGGTTTADAVPDNVRERRQTTDYGSTRLANFRLPVELHDDYKQLIHQTEARHPRLRHLSLTELVIALLEEGPQTTDEVAEMIRRKRTAEHDER